jgi:UDP-N-acetylmuramoyl-tripeptide--D-alanyl-D-alanine ligase
VSRAWLAGTRGKFYASILGRREAVAVAISLAGPGDVVLVAGKGHETTQEIRGVHHPLSDVEEARASLDHPAGAPVVHCFGPEELAEICGGQLRGVPALAWRDRNAGVATDSRQAREGSVFVALAGERFDGHDFLDAVVAAGAQTLIVADARAEEALAIFARGGGGGCVIGVPDTLHALGQLAAGVLDRLRLRRPWLTVVGITGSNGKTTTKEVLAAVLTGWAGFEPHRVHKTPGNFNNFVGLPLTVFGLRWGTDVAVLEMGTNAFGEISRLVQIARPDVTLLTSVGPAHLEGFGSRGGVLRAKAEIFEGGAARGATHIIPAVLADELKSAGLLPALGFETFEVDGAATHQATTLPEPGSVEVVGPLGDGAYRIELRSHLLGRHNRSNVTGAFAAAVSAALRVGKRDLVARGIVDLEALHLPGGRLASRRGVGTFDSVAVLDDCYNANPASMKAGLDCLAETVVTGGRTFAVLGDMFELGRDAATHHHEVGAWAASVGVDALVGFGELAAGYCDGAGDRVETLHVSATGSDDRAVEQVVGFLASRVAPTDTVLVKGSRGMKMERIVARIVNLDED